jgi:hypothetical protein
MPINDPLLNYTNKWQSASQRSNCDFKPLVRPPSPLPLAAAPA